MCLTSKALDEKILKKLNYALPMSLYFIVFTVTTQSQCEFSGCCGSYGQLVYTGMSLTSKALDEKNPLKIELCFASEVVFY